MDADQGGRVVCHDRHPRLYDRAAMALVREAPGGTAQQAGNDALDHWSAVPTGAGKVYLGGPNLAKTKILAKYNTISQVDRLHGGTQSAQAAREWA
jgi:hypothetical protein